VHHTKISAEFEFGVIAHCRGAQPSKMWLFAESRCMMQNVNKTMWAGETSHWTQHPHSTWLHLRRWENQSRLSSCTCICGTFIFFQQASYSFCFKGSAIIDYQSTACFYCCVDRHLQFISNIMLWIQLHRQEFSFSVVLF